MTAAVAERLRPLLAAAWGDPDRAGAHWQRWRTLLPDLDVIDGAEIAVVPVAWVRARSCGAVDPDEGRLRGLQRRAAVQAADTLAAASRVQRELADRGVRSALGGRAAAILSYPSGARWPTPTAELSVSRSDVIAVSGGMAPPPRDRMMGRTLAAPDSTVMLRWRQPDRRPTPWPAPCEYVAWQGRPLWVAPPHEVAYQSLLRGLLPLSAGDPGQAQALLDLQLLSRQPTFDAAAFAAALRASGWQSAFAAHAQRWADVFPGQLTALLGGDIVDLRGTWGRVQARALPAAVRIRHLLPG